MSRFAHFLAIDWSGAKGERHAGIALALADAHGGPPVLVERGRNWSRGEVLALLRDDLPRDTLVGLDLGMALPFADCGAYFPQTTPSPACARDLWALVDDVCSGEAYLGANAFVNDPRFAPFFRRPGGQEGAAFRCDDAGHGRGRFRVTELAQERMGCRPYSNFNLVGAAQVGKSSLTGMRMLHRLPADLPVWPVDPLPETGSVVCEIYTAIAAMEAGRRAGATKMRDCTQLNAGLRALGSAGVADRGALDDHSADALITAAWLRSVAGDARRWHPPGLTDAIAESEGWTFGAL